MDKNLFDQIIEEKPGANSAPDPLSDIPFGEYEDQDEYEIQDADNSSSEENEPKREKVEKPQKISKAAQLSASAAVPALDYSIAMISSAISGREMEFHRMDKGFREEFEGAVAAWAEDEAIDWLSPRYIVIAMFFTYLTLTIVSVVSERKKKRSVVRKMMQKNIDNQINEISEQKEKGEEQRIRYDVDVDGYYERDLSGNYIKKSERKEKAPQDILDIIKKCKENEMSVGETNEFIRKQLNINYVKNL